MRIQGKGLQDSRHVRQDGLRACPNNEKCGPKLKKGEATVSVSQATIDRAAAISEFGSEEYMERASLRNAVEGCRQF
jgi:hypothetical protein